MFILIHNFSFSQNVKYSENKLKKTSAESQSIENKTILSKNDSIVLNVKTNHTPVLSRSAAIIIQTENLKNQDSIAKNNKKSELKPIGVYKPDDPENH